MNSNRVFLIVSVILLGAVGSVSAGLVAHWDFIEGAGVTATDSINNITATLTNYADPNTAWGFADGCRLSGPSTMEFDNVNDHLYVPYTDILDFGTGSFSIAFWLYTPDGDGGEIIHYGTSVDEEGVSSGKRYTVVLTGGQIKFFVDDNDEGLDPIGKRSTSFGDINNRDGIWHHIVCRRIAGTGLDLYVDGVLEGISLFAGGGDFVEAGEDLYIGCQGPDENFGNPFGGKLADLRFYNEAISGAEIAALQVHIPTTHCPTPADGAANIPMDASLHWIVPTDINEPSAWTYDVYIDTDSDFSGIIPITVDNPTVLYSEYGTIVNPGQQNYWRVDAVDPNTSNPIRTGDTWTFNAAAVTLPVQYLPANGTSGNGFEFYLEWISDPNYIYDEVNNPDGIILEHRLVLNNLTDGPSASIDLPADKSHYWFGSDDYPNESGIPSPLWDIIFYGKTYSWKIIELGAGDVVLAESVDEWEVSTVGLQCTGLSVYGDINGDCVVTLDDFAAVGAAWLDCDWRLPNGAEIDDYFSNNPNQAVYPTKDPCQW